MKEDEMIRDGEAANPQDPYREYCYVDTALGDIRNRNKVKRIDEIVVPEPSLECYVSMFRFREEYQRHCEHTGSVRDIDSLPCYCDYLWFDIDDEDLEQARGRAIELVVKLETDFKIRADQLAIYFSGNKGFHMGIPAVLFGAKPSSNLARIFKKMAIELAGSIQIDTSIYDKNRLWRMPNSINSKSGLYKTALTYEELARFDIDTIKKAAAAWRETWTAALSIDERNGMLAGIYNNIIDQLAQQCGSITCGPSVALKPANKPCIERLLGGVGEGERNEAGIRIADHLKKQGMSQENALSALLEWNLKNQPPLPEPEVEASVRSAYSGKYDYGCNDPILKEVCSTDCPLKKKSKDNKPVSTSFVRLSDGSLLEMLYDGKSDLQTSFARFRDRVVEYVDEWTDPTTGINYQPIKPGKIIRSNTIHFPSRADEYGDEAVLLGRIDDFIGRYLVVSPFFQGICKYYVLLSWVYDNFTVVPYLRVRADYGHGKSRFLKTVGALCYKPIFCSGAATVSPIFRLIDTYRGTLIIDESDFTDSDESHRMIKILNSGFQEGFPVLLTETLSSNKLEPMSFEVFGPKLIASRHEFKDKALESRCVTEVMDNTINSRIPLALPGTFWDEARGIRNQLLLWRFHKWGKIVMAENRLRDLVEPRLAQIMVPLLSVIDDPHVRDEFVDFIKIRNQQLIEERGESLEGKVAQATCNLWKDASVETIRVKEVTDSTNKILDNSRFEIRSRKTGEILRKTFNLNLQRDGKGYYLKRTEPNLDRLQKIARKYGIDLEHPGERSQCSQCASPVGGQGVML